MLSKVMSSASSTSRSINLMAMERSQRITLATIARPKVPLPHSRTRRQMFSSCGVRSQEVRCLGAAAAADGSETGAGTGTGPAGTDTRTDKSGGPTPACCPTRGSTREGVLAAAARDEACSAWQTRVKHSTAKASTAAAAECGPADEDRWREELAPGRRIFAGGLQPPEPLLFLPPPFSGICN